MKGGERYAFFQGMPGLWFKGANDQHVQSHKYCMRHLMYTCSVPAGFQTNSGRRTHMGAEVSESAISGGARFHIWVLLAASTPPPDNTHENLFKSTQPAATTRHTCFFSCAVTKPRYQNSPAGIQRRMLRIPRRDLCSSQRGSALFTIKSSWVTAERSACLTSGPKQNHR